MENRQQRQKDGCMTQILVARAPPSPQFYCARRSIQAARILPGARLEILHGSAFASHRPPALLSLPHSPISFPWRRYHTWPLLLVRRLPSRFHRAVEFNLRCHNDFFFLRSWRWTFGAPTTSLLWFPVCFRQDVTRDKSRAYSAFK